ncbi:hypothetical protein NFI96_020099, partial [Prochilodus magdalenae]
SQCDEKLEQVISKRDGEIVRLREEVQRLHLTLQQAQQSTANHISRLQQQLANKIENIERLKAKLDSQQDYEKIKEELRCHSIFNVSDTLMFHPLIPLSTHSLLLSLPLEFLKKGNGLQSTSTFSREESFGTPCIAFIDSNIFFLPIFIFCPAVEIKREVQNPHSSSDLVEELSKAARIRCRLPEPTRRTTPSPCPQSVSPHDAVPYLCIETNNNTEGPLQADTSGATESDMSASVMGSITLNGNLVEGGFLESIENHIETSEIAQRVKELLHRHKIGQRVFGQFVLDRLQGSVSEILAHPKPWSKLTARGKEPFLRMAHFLSDGQNVLALRMIQDGLRAELDPSSKTLGSSSPGHQSADMGSEDVIRNILEQAKKELQTQSGGNKIKTPQDQRRNTQICAAPDDNAMGSGSEDFIKSILEQARHEIHVQQNVEDRNSERAGDHSIASDFQVKQEEEEGCGLDQPPPDHNLLNPVSPTDFVQNIIRKVKSELGTGSISSAGSPLLPTLSSASSSSIAHPVLSDSSQNPALTGKQDKLLASGTKGEMQCFGMKVSPGNDHAGYGGPDPLLLESYKENHQPPQTQDEQTCAGALSHPLPDLHNRRDTEQLMLQLPALDTLGIARRVKEILAEHNLGQRLFGEQVLGLTQGSVSDLLARPKPWGELSKKGREPFLRMYHWLKDPHNVEFLKAMKSAGYRVHVKRPFSLLSTGSDDAFRGAHLDCIFDHPGQFSMAKRPRVMLTSQEKEILNKAFQLEPYPSHYTTQRLALQLGLQPSTVTNWFYNHRSRLRRTAQDGGSVTAGYSNSPFPATEAAAQHHVTGPNPHSYSSLPHTDTSLVTFKQEPSDVEISEVKEEEPDTSWNTQYVSTGVQSCRSMKVEEKEERIVLSPQLEDGIRFDKMVKEEPCGTGHDARTGQEALEGASFHITTSPPNPDEPSICTHLHTAAEER